MDSLYKLLKHPSWQLGSGIIDAHHGSGFGRYAPEVWSLRRCDGVCACVFVCNACVCVNAGLQCWQHGKVLVWRAGVSVHTVSQDGFECTVSYMPADSHRPWAHCFFSPALISFRILPDYIDPTVFKGICHKPATRCSPSFLSVGLTGQKKSLVYISFLQWEECFFFFFFYYCSTII